MTNLLIDATDALLLDLDGTVYHGANPIPSAVSALAKVRTQRPSMDGTAGDGAVAIRFVTNNASRLPQTVADALQAMGVQCSAAEVLTSAQAGVGLMAQKIPAGSAVYVLGSEALRTLVADAGFRVVDSADDAPAAVIHGHNPATGWAQLSEACLAINAGAVYVATNLDTTLPAERGMMVGNGSMVAALATATGVHPESAGKPGPAMFHQATADAGASRPLGVGDRLNTDIAGGVAAHVDTLMLLTGVSGELDLIRATPAERPTYIARSMDTALFSAPAATTPAPQPGWSVEVAGNAVRLRYVGEYSVGAGAGASSVAGSPSGATAAGSPDGGAADAAAGRNDAGAGDAPIASASAATVGGSTPAASEDVSLTALLATAHAVWTAYPDSGAPIENVIAEDDVARKVVESWR